MLQLNPPDILMKDLLFKINTDMDSDVTNLYAIISTITDFFIKVFQRNSSYVGEHRKPLHINAQALGNAPSWLRWSLGWIRIRRLRLPNDCITSFQFPFRDFLCSAVSGATNWNQVIKNLKEMSFIYFTHCMLFYVLNRYLICRNLLLLQNIILEKTDAEWKSVEAIRSVCSLETVVLTQASFVSLWLTTLPALTHPLL